MVPCWRGFLLCGNPCFYTTAIGTVFDTYPNQYTEMIQLVCDILSAVDLD